MSLIVAIKEKGVVYFGFDSQYVVNRMITNNLNESNYPVWKLNHNLNTIMASSGSRRYRDIFKTNDIVKDKESKLDYGGIVKDLIPAMRTELVEYKMINEDKELLMDSRFFLAQEGSLFLIDRDGAVIEMEKMFALGDADEVALGSMEALKDMDIKERMIEVFKIAEKVNIYVSFPIILIDTKTMEYEIIKK